MIESSRITVTKGSRGVYRLHLDDPPTRNRVDRSLSQELKAALEGLSTEPELKVLVWTGRPDVFCAGASLDLLKELSSGALQVRDLVQPRALMEFPVPVIGALEGSALGGGLALALSCELLVASASARYGFNFADLGFTPELGTTALLPALVGSPFAAEMLLTGKLYKGSELRGRGLFNYVVPQAEVVPAALDLAARMAEQPRHVLVLLKEALALPRLRAVNEAVSREHLMQALCFGRADTAALLAANYRK